MRDDVSPIVDPLDTLTNLGYSRYDVFSDWVDLMHAAIQQDPNRYHDILDNYEDQRWNDSSPNMLFWEAFAALYEQMKLADRELLGEVYETMGIKSENFGQHFTPHNVAAAKAQILMLTEEEAESPPVTVADPACGSGRLILHAARTCEENTVCFGQDKDPLCAQMAALNFYFFDISGVVACGDSLTRETQSAWVSKELPYFGHSLVKIDISDKDISPHSLIHRLWPTADSSPSDSQDTNGQSTADDEPVPDTTDTDSKKHTTQPSTSGSSLADFIENE